MNLLELLQDRNIPFRRHGEHHHTSAGFIQLDCISCSKDSGRFRLGFNLEHGFFSCWICGFRPFYETISELLDIPIQECKGLVSKPENTLLTLTTRPRGKLVLPDGVGPLQPQHIRYLRSRNMPVNAMKTLWLAQGIGLSSKWPWRVLLPITYRGRTVSWTARTIADNVRPKYANARPEEEVLAKSELLFGEDYARHSIIVCEGPFDSIKIGPGAVALMGLKWTETQIRKISKYPRRVICFDTEPAAQRRAKKLCELLSVYDGKTDRVEVDAKDPGSASRRELNKLRKAYLE